MEKCSWAKRETKFLGFIVGNGIVLMSPKFATVKDWPLPETQKQIKSFVAISFYRKCIHPFADCSSPLTDVCRKSLPGRVVHSVPTRPQRTEGAKRANLAANGNYDEKLAGMTTYEALELGLNEVHEAACALSYIRHIQV